MAARIDHGRAQLLTRTGLDWTDKYPSAIAALANLNVKAAYLDGELCGVDDAGLPSFANTQAATDGERGVRLRRANIISGRHNLVVATLPKRDYQGINRGGDGRNDGE
jgi:ATP-dependent DNA ligase